MPGGHLGKHGSDSGTDKYITSNAYSEDFGPNGMKEQFTLSVDNRLNRETLQTNN